MLKQDPIKVAILWHMHQPDYREPNADRLAMPWVRLHAIKDYLDMPLLAGAFEHIRVTFNLVPSLIDQLHLYLNGGTDHHLELTQLKADELSNSRKLEILESFFLGHPPNMIEPYARYRELYKKYAASAGQKEVLPALFTSAEIRDLQVWSNLAWVDPMFRSEEPIKTLFDKHRYFTEDDKQELIAWQKRLIARIIPAYRELQEQGRIEVSFTPYYHPILPLLCDTDIAREALPGIKLPERRFTHPEDAEHQVSSALAKYEELFGRKMNGMWPSEGSVSNDVLRLLNRRGLKWTATDEEILSQSLAKANLPAPDNAHHFLYEFGPGLKLFFRDHRLSDLIGFVYSGWQVEDAVKDFVNHLMAIRRRLGDDVKRAVIPVILDGENAWEFYASDGHDFLSELYRELDDHPYIQTVTMSEAVDSLPTKMLPDVFAGSWINHNFRIWIGHEEDNAAWDALQRTRDALDEFQKTRTEFDPEKLKLAWERIYVAEGSDWCWWYGDEHRGAYNEEFDSIFRRHLIAVYEALDLTPPSELHRPIHRGGENSLTMYPEDILTAQIDGRISHFYEWAGAGLFDCLKASGTMHRADRHLSGIYFAYDHNRFYIRLDFYDKKNVESLKQAKFRIALFTPAPIVITLHEGPRGIAGEETGHFEYAMDEILELAIERNYLWPSGYGSLGFTVSVYDGDKLVESWPENEPIQLDVPEKNKEIFWPS